MKEIKIIIKGKPLSVNQTYKTRISGKGMYLSEKAMGYGNSVIWQVRSQYKDKLLEEDLEVSFYYYFGDKRIHDHLNYHKLLCDRLNQILWKDDKQIKTSHHYTMFDKKNPRIEIFIKAG